MAADRTIKNAKDRGLKLVVALTNQLVAGGGACQYVTWAGIPVTIDGDAPSPDAEYAFYTNSTIKQWYKNYVSMVLNRVNTATGVAYKDEPTIMAWELINEGANPNDNDPTTAECAFTAHHASSRDTAGNVIRDWYQEMARHIKSIDSNHLVTTGEQGFDEGIPSVYTTNGYGNTYWLRACTGSSFIKNTTIPEIDFTSIHLYPEGFGLTDDEAITFIEDHLRVARAAGKPLWLGEYGRPGGNPDDAAKVNAYPSWWSTVESEGIAGDALWQFTDDTPGFPSWANKCEENSGNICASKDPTLTGLLKDHGARMAAKSN